MKRALPLIAALLLASACSSPAPSTPTATASPVVAVTTTPTARTATSSPTTTVAPSATIGQYVNTTYKFGLVLPDPYRNSARLSLASTGGQRLIAQDAFTARTDADEATVSGTGCQTACPIWNYVAVVEIYAGTGGQTPRQFYTASGGAVGETIEDTTVDGRVAVKVTNGVPYPFQYVVRDGDRMFRIADQMYVDMPVPAGASKSKLEQILASFRFMP